MPVTPFNMEALKLLTEAANVAKSLKIKPYKDKYWVFVHPDQLYVFHYSLPGFSFAGSTEDTGPFVVTALY